MHKKDMYTTLTCMYVSERLPSHVMQCIYKYVCSRKTAKSCDTVYIHTMYVYVAEGLPSHVMQCICRRVLLQWAEMAMRRDSTLSARVRGRQRYYIFGAV